MDDESVYMTPIPTFSPLQSSIETEFQSQLEYSSERNEDNNRNHLESGSFYLQLTFNGNRRTNGPSFIQLSSQSLENEARRYEEQLTSSQDTLSTLEAEVAQLERANKELSSESEVDDLMELEQVTNRLEEELAQCRTYAIRSSEELVLKTAAAKATRTKRFETEHVLRELQLSICRRKLEHATAKALSEEDDIGDSSDEESSISVLNLPEEEERITIIQNKLDELTELNNHALSEAKEAELRDANRQNELTRAKVDMEQRICMSRSECEARRQNLEEKRQQLEINRSYLVTLRQKTVHAKLGELLLLQHMALIDAARKVEKLERSAQTLMGVNTPQCNGWQDGEFLRAKDRFF